MWGSERWGEMVWGAAAVPALPLGLLVVLLLGCFLAGGYFLRPGQGGRRRWLAAALVIAAPLAVTAVPYTFSNGTVADANEVNADFSALDGALAAVETRLAGESCPAGMTLLDAPYGWLCYANGPIGTWDLAASYCWDQYRAHVCSSRQWQDAVCRSGIPNPGVSWTSELVGAATAGAISGCSAENFAPTTYTAQRRATCCLEWARY